MVGKISFAGALAAAKDTLDKAKAETEAAAEVIVEESELGEPPAKKPKKK